MVARKGNTISSGSRRVGSTGGAPHRPVHLTPEAQETGQVIRIHARASVETLPGKENVSRLSRPYSPRPLVFLLTPPFLRWGGPFPRAPSSVGSTLKLVVGWASSQGRDPWGNKDPPSRLWQQCDPDIEAPGIQVREPDPGTLSTVFIRLPRYPIRPTTSPLSAPTCESGGPVSPEKPPSPVNSVRPALAAISCIETVLAGFDLVCFTSFDLLHFRGPGARGPSEIGDF